MIGNFILNFVWGKIVGLAVSLYQRYSRKKNIEEESAKQTEGLKKEGQNAEETDQAIDSALNKL